MARDRRDGKLVRETDPMHAIMTHIMPYRCDSEVYINQKMDVTQLVKYYEKEKKNNPDLTYYHMFVTMAAKVVFNKPLLNRFVINKKTYDRNEVSIAYTAKVTSHDESKELLNVIKFDKDDNLYSIKDKVLTSVEKVRNSKDEGGVNGIMKIVANLPRPIMSIVVKIVQFMDRHDLLPQSIMDDNLYYSTLIISNLGSIKGGAIYHHLAEFGTSSILFTIGEIKKEKVIMSDGKEEIRDICEFGITLDERIADGVYFIKAAHMMQDILNNPKSLEDKVSNKLEDSLKLKY